MLIATTWKARPLSPAQADRMMAVWGKMEADQASNTSTERVCWFITADGTAGIDVVDVKDPDGAVAFFLELTLALGEFLEMDTRPVLDLDSAMPAILAGMARSKE